MIFFAQYLCPVVPLWPNNDVHICITIYTHSVLWSSDVPHIVCTDSALVASTSTGLWLQLWTWCCLCQWVFSCSSIIYYFSSWFLYAMATVVRKKLKLKFLFHFIYFHPVEPKCDSKCSQSDCGNNNSHACNYSIVYVPVHAHPCSTIKYCTIYVT